MKKQMCFILIIVLLLLTACSKFNTEDNAFVYNENSKYDIYFNHVGNIGFIQVEDIKKGNIKHGKMRYMATKNDDRMVYKIVSSEGKKVYASVRTPGSNKANRLIALQKGKIEKEVVFTDNHKPAEVINDVEYNRVFVELTQSNAINLPLGTPVRVVDYATDEYYDCNFYIKGGIFGHDINGDYIYGVSSGAKESLYTDVPDTHIFKIERKTLEMKILSEKDLGYLPRDLKVSPNGKIYITTNGHVEMVDPENPETTTYTSEDSLCIYDLDGNFQKKVNLKQWCNQIIISEEGIAYISHSGKRRDNDFKGDLLTIFDTNTDEVIRTIEGLSGITTMELKDDYLFIYTSEKQSITIMDSKSFEILGEIPVDYKGFCVSMTVVKNSN
ncbi:MAG: hypothetical protein BWY74_03335 [Firmicutes bacterium ADurb.Bin419]|nr:MAG: hypothetical protein BWY74_03335 [Firmicutes bacterium ADurb.Bin419]